MDASLVLKPERLGPTFVEVVRSLAILSMLVLLLPLALLAIGTPLALALRAIVAIGQWVATRL